MRLPTRRLLIAGAGTGVVLVIGVLAAVTESWTLAISCVLLLQTAAVVGLLALLRRTSESAAALARLRRDVTNVSARVVTEARALESGLSALATRRNDSSAAEEGGD